MTKNKKSNNTELIFTINSKKDLFSGLDKSQKVTSISSKNQSKPVDEKIRKWDINDRIVKLFEDSIGNDMDIKGNYAITLIVILAIQLVVLNIIFILVGVGVLHYSDFTFNLFITGGLAEIFVLIRVIVKNIFNNNLAEALKIILDRNNQRLFNYNKSNNKKKNDNKDIEKLETCK